VKGPLFLAEDEALRNHLKGLIVSDQRAANEGVARPVGVWFGQPDQELRDQSYPYITIDMIDVAEARERAMRGVVSPYYLEPELGSDEGWEIDMPIPINIDYQVTTFARNPRHDRQILSQLMFDKLRLRFGYLLPNDSTVRRLDVLDITKRDTVEAGKRLFMNAITVRVSSEVSQTEAKNIYKVQGINISGPNATPRQEYIGPISDNIY
jgi:hypothetical protein